MSFHIEPHFQLITGEVLTGATLGAQLEITIYSTWGAFLKAYNLMYEYLIFLPLPIG